MLLSRPATVVATLLALSIAACAPALRRTTESHSIDELWVDPGASRDNVFDGPGGPRGPRPALDGRYDVIKEDRGGFSITYQVRDPGGVEWNVKIGPEARTEVISSRIVWALGFHQVPSYFIPRWIAVDNGRGRLLGGGRFRPARLPMNADGEWSWHRNPFVGTRAYRGLLVLMVMLNSTDLKDDNNEIYIGRDAGRSQRWYVVKDLGASLGETGRMDPRRGYLAGFEREPFIVSAKGQRLKFGFRGRHQELLDAIRPEDVRWMAERVMRLTDQQWRDAFRAGGIDGEQTARYVARVRAKAKEGLALR